MVKPYRLSVRPIRVEGDVAYVPLTKGYEAIMDAADVPLADKWNWYAKINCGRVYACRNGYSDKGRTNIYLHRVILNSPLDKVGDHISGDSLDNRMANLRVATTSENLRNRGIPADNKSGAKGVSWKQSAKKWWARITVNGKMKDLGCYDTVEEAAGAYNRAAPEVHGKFYNTGTGVS